ncbi:MAG: DNA repair protein RecN [Lewinellaceae bacterium]|nr:DNA repair protein RecN [Saprospiraceae bacterium]MCB9345338.1 DNA repair protein RecN [Lewinellaceae bacterium]
MLKSLHIRNYALIDRLEINFSQNLTIITGETGAGKSILLGALGLVMGERADSKVFYNDAEKCIVEAFFDVGAYDLTSFFEQHELDYDQEVVIRRELSPTGKSRAFINDTPVNNQVLQRLTESLIDLHQQFDVLDIHDVNFQLRMIDALADNFGLLKEYQQAYKSYSGDKKRLENLISQSEKGTKELEFLQFQLEELQQANLENGEQDELEQELSRLSNAEEIKRSYGTAFNYLLQSEQNIAGQLQEISRSLNQTSAVSPELASLSSRMDSLVLDLQDIAKEFERISETTEHDPERIAQVQDRLDTIYKLQKKHGVSSLEDLLTIQSELEKQSEGFANMDSEISRLQESIDKQERALKEKASSLSQRRKKIPDVFEAQVHKMLEQLSMPHAKLKVDIKELPGLSPTGMDDVQFLFASNVGSKYLPIRDVASGGELSRLTLCTKSLVADAIPLPTLIFDEIDYGVSGDVSLKMGNILKELSKRHQVVSITHTPQIAARADAHYFVYKKITENRSITNIRLLEPEDRIRSIAVMLSGNPPSDAALATARELVHL